jgi:peptide/nickel transport system substrate-binding protein
MKTPRSRRTLGIAGSLVAAGGLLATALGTSTHASFAAHASAPHRSAQPGYGGTLATYGGQPDCLDPQKTALGASYAIFSHVTDSLVALDAHGHPRPNLALNWKVAKGGTQITFFLRHGVRFSNGDPFTAQDVKYTFDRAVNPATKSPVTAGQLAQVASTKVVNTYTVQVNLKAPFRPVFTNLGNGYTGIIDRKAVQKEGDAGFCQNPIGTGPYKVASTGAAFDTVVLAANKYHTWYSPVYRNHGRPYISTVVVRYLSDDSTIGSELSSGALDYGTVPGTQVSRLQGDSKLALHRIPAQGELFLGFNTARAPFNNLQVRKAVAEAIDRAGLIKAGANGQAVAQYSPLASEIPYFDKHAKNFLPANNAAAARRVIAANHATGPYTLLAYTQGSETSTDAEIIQAELAQMGMTVNIVMKPIGDYLSQAAKGQFDMNLLGYGYSDPDILYMLFHSSQGKGAGINFTNYVNPTLDNLLVKGRTTLNAKKAAQYYAQAQELMNKQVVVVPLYSNTNPQAVSTRIKGYYQNNLNVAPPIGDWYVIGK